MFRSGLKNAPSPRDSGERAGVRGSDSDRIHCEKHVFCRPPHPNPLPLTRWRGDFEMTSTKLLLACGSLIGVIACADVAAQNYPVKPALIIVPTPAGGNPDFIARPVAQKMSESLRQTFIIDNRPGAAGTIGVELATRAVPDGYTLLFGAIGHIA